MLRPLKKVLDRLRTRSAIHERDPLHRAVEETRRRRSRDWSIWRTGKGGAHHDR